MVRQARVSEGEGGVDGAGGRRTGRRGWENETKGRDEKRRKRTGLGGTGQEETGRGGRRLAGRLTGTE